MKNKRGITLIALVITIIVLLILAGVTIASLLGENGVIMQAQNAKFKTNLSQLEEEIDIYKYGQVLNEVTGIEKYPVIKSETMESIDKDLLSTDLKNKMLKWASTAGEGEIPTIDNIDYSKFYKIDKDKVQSANNFKGDLYLIEVGNEYKVISIEGEVFQFKRYHILIPLDDIADPEYITVSNNTYKLYGDGTLKVVGKNVANSGKTPEEDKELTGIQEFKIDDIIKNTDIAIDKNVDTTDEFAKKYGIKRIYIYLGTAYIIDANDDLWAWGDNSYNKLGQGNSYIITKPKKILENRTEGATNVKAKEVWAGYANTYVLDTNNNLWGCGPNTMGELGQGNFDNYNNFVQIKIDGVDLNTVRIKKVSVSKNTQVNSVIIQCDNGKIYGCGNNQFGQLGIKNKTNQNKLVDLTNYDTMWNDIKDFYNHGLYTIALRNDGTLYGCGYNNTGSLGISNLDNIIQLTKIADNVEEFGLRNHSELLFKDKDGGLHYANSGKFVDIENIKDKNAKIIQEGYIVIDGKLYDRNANKTNLVVYTDEYKNIENTRLTNVDGNLVFISNGKMYVLNAIDIVKPTKLAIYQLREIASDVTFVQGRSGNLSIVDYDGNIYEGLNNKNSEIKNAKKLISSSASRYVLTNDKKVYAKGSDMTGLWGSLTSQTRYQLVKNENGQEFQNVKDIFTTNTISTVHAASFVMKTEDDKLYWAGSDSVTPFPGIKGDLSTTGMGLITKQPKEITSNTINNIKNKIVDIQMNYINQAGIQGSNAIILTEDGKIYTYAKGRMASVATGLNKAVSDFEELVIEQGNTVKEIQTQDGLSLALMSNGDVYGWGYNTYGILGKNYEIGGIYPTPVKLDISNIRTMSLGEKFAIFATNTGEVYGIGSNNYGQLGTGNSEGANDFVRCVELEK